MQTQSLTKHSEYFEPGYRTIEFKEGNIFIQPPVELTPERPDMISGSLNCPADLSAYDSEGRRTGPSSGKVDRNIPDSFYFSGYIVTLYDNTNYSAPETILLYNTCEEYVFEIRANFSENELNSAEEQHFNFTIKQRSDSGTTEVVYEFVPLTANTVATIPISLTTQKYEMMIDTDGDGTIDEIREPDSIQTIIIGSITVSNLESTSGSTWINFTWTNPSDPDFNYTEIYLNGIFQTSASAEYFNATGLEPKTGYTIGTRTVDIYGNVDETWVNATAVTKTIPDEKRAHRGGKGTGSARIIPAEPSLTSNEMEEPEEGDESLRDVRNVDIPSEEAGTAENLTDSGLTNTPEEAEASETEGDGEENKTPGFQIVFAISGLLAVLCLLRNQQK